MTNPNDPVVCDDASSGLTKREEFTLSAMRALVMYGSQNPTFVAQRAVELADATIAELNRTTRE